MYISAINFVLAWHPCTGTLRDILGMILQIFKFEQIQSYKFLIEIDLDAYQIFAIDLGRGQVPLHENTTKG